VSPGRGRDLGPPVTSAGAAPLLPRGDRDRDRGLRPADSGSPLRALGVDEAVEIAGRSGDSVIEALGLVKTYDAGRVRALDGVDLTVCRGEFVAVTGPSGCGKSTLLHLIAALAEPTHGIVRVNGRDLSKVRNLARFRRNEIGLVFQLHNLFPRLTAAANVEVAMLGTSRSRRDRVERANELLGRVDLAGREKRRPTQLSGGERQRVAIARALANEPQLLLADEPSGNLDTASVERLLELFGRLRSEEGVTILLVTHDPTVASAADRIIQMRDGRVVNDL
jgi:ABC-type lipoprotein export system ATPase subunit